MPKLLEDTLGPWTNVLLAVACVAAVWLLMRDMGIGMKKDGFDNAEWGNGSYLAGVGGTIRTDGRSPAEQPYLLYGVPSAVNSKAGFSGARAGMGDNEYPVFWNPGSYIDVDDMQQANINADENADLPESNANSNGKKDSFSSFGLKNPPPYMLSGFQNPQFKLPPLY